MTTTYEPMVAEIASAHRAPTDRPVTDSDYKFFYNVMTASDFYAALNAGTLTFTGTHNISKAA